MLWSTLSFIITISILVTAHEFGHFIVARCCGVKVECFSIGFGKKLWSHKFLSGTEFVIAMIPLGGYVRMLDGRIKPLEENEKQFAFDHKKIWQRTSIIAAGPVANFLLAWLVYWIIFQLGVVVAPVKIEQTLPNTPASTVSIPSGAEIKTFDNIKIDSWTDVNSAIISAMGKEQISLSYVRSDNEDIVQQTEKTINISGWQFDVEKQSAITAFGFVPKPLEIYPIVSKIVSGSSAEKAGMKIGDEIVSYSGHPYTKWDDFSAVIRQAGLIKLTVKRGNQIVNLDLVPFVESSGRGLAGIYPTLNTINKQYGVVEALGKGFVQTKLTLNLTVRSLYQLVTGVIGIKNLSGPITIAKNAGQTASHGIVSYLYFLAFISISLGVINLVPLPILDGGHLVFLFVEKIKGRALSEATQAIFYRLGFVILMIIMGIALFNDFLRL